MRSSLVRHMPGRRTLGGKLKTLEDEFTGIRTLKLALSMYKSVISAVRENNTKSTQSLGIQYVLSLFTCSLVPRPLTKNRKGTWERGYFTCISP